MKRIIILILVAAAPSVFVILDAMLNTGILDLLKWQWVQLTGTPEDQTRYLLSGSHMIRVKKARPANTLPDWTNYETLLSQCPAEDAVLFTRDEWVKLDARVILWCWYREVLIEYPSLYIEFFDDYAPNQYRVSKRVFEGVMRKISGENPGRILGGVITGPYGALWSYQTFVFQSEGDHVVVIRSIIMHARFRCKSSARLTNREYDNLMTELQMLAANAGDFYASHLNIRDTWNERFLDDWSYQALICEWEENKSICHPLLYGSDYMEQDAELELFNEKSIKTLDRLLVHELKWTILYYLPP